MLVIFTFFQNLDELGNGICWRRTEKLPFSPVGISKWQFGLSGTFETKRTPEGEAEIGWMQPPDAFEVVVHSCVAMTIPELAEDGWEVDSNLSKLTEDQESLLKRVESEVDVFEWNDIVIGSLLDLESSRIAGQQKRNGK